MNKSINSEVNSKILPATKLMILLHGVGTDGSDLIDLSAYIKNYLPNCHFFAPDGLEPYDQAAYGRQWFSIQNRDAAIMQRLLERNIASIMAIIKQKQEALHVSNKNTIVMGFSQGAMVGLYLTLIQAKPFLATIGFSGLLLPPKQCINHTTPICLIHGLLDQVITVDALEHAARYLSQHYIPHSSYKLPDLGHTIDSRGLQYAMHFIQDTLAKI